MDLFTDPKITGIYPLMTKSCRHFLIHGKVQGVFYRANTKKQALALHLSGWVCNLTDGRVQVLAQGEPAALDALEAWLHQGPPHANVRGVDLLGTSPFDPKLTDFTIGADKNYDD
jgi:acylphosphatase